MFCSIFIRGVEGREGEQITSKTKFLLPPNCGDLEGREEKLIKI
jgi:hypothetical protein